MDTDMSMRACVYCYCLLLCRHPGCCRCAVADAPHSINSRGATQAAVCARPVVAVAVAVAALRLVDLWTAIAAEYEVTDLPSCCVHMASRACDCHALCL